MITRILHHSINRVYYDLRHLRVIKILRLCQIFIQSIPVISIFVGLSTYYRINRRIELSGWISAMRSRRGLYFFIKLTEISNYPTSNYPELTVFLVKPYC